MVVLYNLAHCMFNVGYIVLTRINRSILEDSLCISGGRRSELLLVTKFAYLQQVLLAAYIGSGCDVRAFIGEPKVSTRAMVYTLALFYCLQRAVYCLLSQGLMC